MADDNQQPENNEPLENNQWEEKKWQENKALMLIFVWLVICFILFIAFIYFICTMSVHGLLVMIVLGMIFGGS